MHEYLITPLAPLVLRGGKPVDANTGNDVFGFPLPSTLAGALRTAYADKQGHDFGQQRKTIESWPCAGPLLAELDTKGQAAPLFPKPQDALYIKADDALKIHRLSPLEDMRSPNEGCDLPDANLLPVALKNSEKSKPAPGPQWWTYAAMRKWLLGEIPAVETLGHHPLPADVRFHVALNDKTLTAEPGLLYQSAGIDFDAQRDSVGGWRTHRYALLARFGQDIPAGMVRVGGEGRLSALDKAKAWPAPSQEFIKALQNAERIRLILVTPALFQQGWRPAWLENGECPAVPGLKLKLRAAAVDRWQAVSGWDIQKKKPKAVRRMVPAGSVYWFEIVGTAPPNWAEKLWCNSISDDERDRRDGFGLTIPGVWN